MLIFLDIDGVMVPAASWKTPELMEDGFPMFSEKAVQGLKSILFPGSKIILSTSHRDRFTIQEWKEIFAKRGLHVKNLDRLPSSKTHGKRKDEIQQWFSAHVKPKVFVIIDDDKTLFDLPRDLKDHLVITSSLVGLTPENLKDVNGLILAPA
ncbi:HAD domain-containing protein [Algoriphagus sp.]|uniref:HAD domain-containing protein n=1 Tax=Algoriphagus sp. TaxID=1872435 RepID=UPI00391CB187